MQMTTMNTMENIVIMKKQITNIKKTNEKNKNSKENEKNKYFKCDDKNRNDEYVDNFELIHLLFNIISSSIIFFFLIKNNSIFKLKLIKFLN